MSEYLRPDPAPEQPPVEDEQKYIWQVLKRETVHTSKWLNLYRDWVRLPDGSVIEGHHVIEFPRPAVGVVAVNLAGDVMLIDHYRFITKIRNWEVPAGGIDEGETPEEAARRELKEESGCTGGELVYLSGSYPSHGSSNQFFHYYLVQGAEQTQPIEDTNEIIGARFFSPAELRRMLDQNIITDGFTQTALLLAFFKGYLA